MMVSGIDLNTHLSNGTIEPYELGSVNLLSACVRPNVLEILLPNCDESHAIAGGWLLDGIEVKAKVLNYTKVLDMSKYGYSIEGKYQYPPPIYFIALPDWELIVEQNPFNHTVSIYFRQIRKC